MNYPDDFINKVIQGDCLEVIKNIPDNSIDLIVTDPPYGIDYQSNMRVMSEKFDKIANDNNDARFPVYDEMHRVLKDNSVMIAFCSFKNYADDYKYIEKLFDIKNCIVWFKGGGGIGDLSHSLSTDYELAIVGHKGQCELRGKRHGSVWKSNKVNPNIMLHPTQKPEDIIAKMIDTFSDQEAIVLDPFLGSGTTAVAAKQLGRNFIGIELSEKYCEIANQRLRQDILL